MRTEVLLFCILFVFFSILTLVILKITNSFLPASRSIDELLDRIFFLKYADDIDKNLIHRNSKIIFLFLILPLVSYAVLTAV
jgi:hypothetical protein